MSWVGVVWCYWGILVVKLRAACVRLFLWEASVLQFCCCTKKQEYSFSWAVCNCLSDKQFMLLRQLPMCELLMRCVSAKKLPQVPLWGELRSCEVPLLLVAGQLDGKFAGIKRRMMARLRQGLSGSSSSAPDTSGSSSSTSSNGVPPQQQQQVMIRHQWAEVPGAGHAVHVEAPLQLLQLITSFTATL